jgi:mono/diheme cytochrome c family protein
MIKRLSLLLIIALVLGGILMLFSYDIIKLDYISFMEIQPSFKPMEKPLPVPPKSIPIEGAAYISGLGAPENPVPADEVSLARGEQLFDINCAICHGQEGLGNGKVGMVFTVHPANLTLPAVQDLSDGAIFLIVSRGVPNRMPALNENLTVRDRWDVVNYVRTLKK